MSLIKLRTILYHRLNILHFNLFHRLPLLFTLIIISCHFFARVESTFDVQQTTPDHSPPIFLNYSHFDENDVVNDRNFRPNGHCTFDDCETDEIVVRIKNGIKGDEIRRIEQNYGYKFAGRVGDLDVYYFKRKDNSRVKRHAFQPIFDDPNVEWAEVQFPKKRIKRDFKRDNRVSSLKLPWPDPLYTKQWYLRAGAIGGFDMKVREAWALGYTGKNIVVSILDDGVQGSHPDLVDNYDPLASTDINSGDEDPTPRNDGDNKHGTRCAGEVASVAGNAWCGVGIAYNAKIGGVRMLDGPVSDRVEGAALAHNQQHIDIYSASWGPDDDGKTFDGPGSLAKMAFYQGITKGRKGKGNIFIWASGNGGNLQDSCSCDGYTTSIYTLSVSSATFDNHQPWYLEECPSTLCTTYSSANRGQPAIISTDMPNSCTEQHTGTSASAPIAAGIVALTLEANGNLTWRDMQHLVIRTSNPKPLLDNPGWSKNGVGRLVSNKFGYGLMNAEALVQTAKTWKPVPPHRVCSYFHKMMDPDHLHGQFSRNYSLYVSGRCLHTSIVYLEHVQSLVSIQYRRRGDLVITLTSPRGTRSVLLPPRPRDHFQTGFQKWPFMSVQQWGENPEGYWTLTIQNVKNDSSLFGVFNEWSITLYGTDTPAQPDDPVSPSDNALPIVDAHQQETSNHLEPGGGGGGVFAGDQHSIDQQQPPRQEKILRQNCHEECSSNDGCYVENSALDCVICKNFKHYLRNRGGEKCVKKCDDGYYADVETKRCNQCLNGCRTCTQAAYCDTCPDNTLLVDIDPENFHHGRCAAQCPEGFVNATDDGKTLKCVAICDKNCLTCRSHDQCQYCKENFYLSPARQCLNSCPEGYFADKDFRKCQECLPQCVKCRGKTHCLECSTGYVWNATLSACRLEGRRACKENPDCPSGQYCEISDFTCQVCHVDCVDCTGPAYDQCVTCKSGQPLDARTKQCLPCHAGQYYDAQTGECSPCEKSCAVCMGASRTQCTKCRKGFKQLGSLCEPCCTKENSRSHGVYCITCPEETGLNENSLLPKSTGQLAKLIIGLLIAGVLFSVLLMAFLMCRDRNYSSGAKKYAYSKIPLINGETESDENNSLLKQSFNKLQSLDENDNNHNNLTNGYNNSHELGLLANSSTVSSDDENDEHSDKQELIT